MFKSEFKRLGNILVAGVMWTIDNASILIVTVVGLLLKFIFFLGIVNNDNTSVFNLQRALLSFSARPPLLVYTAFIMIILCFAFLFKKRARFCFLVVCNFLISLLLLFDIMHFRGFSAFLSPYLLSETTNLNNLTSDVISMLRPIDSLFFLDLIIIIAVGVIFKRLHNQAKRNVYVLIVCLFLSGSYLYYQHVRLDINGTGDMMLFKESWVPNQTMSNLSPIGYHAFDIYNFIINEHVTNITSSEKQKIKNWFDVKHENLPPNQFSGLFKGQNLLIIQVESLENSVINQKINGQEITPTLNKLLANSLYFPNYYEQVNTGNSSDSDLMTNASVYPVRSGAAFFRFPSNTYNSLPKMLEAVGYDTVAIHSDIGSYWNWMPALTAMGFNKTIDEAYFKMDEKIGLGLSDASYLKQIAPFLTSQKAPFYNFLVTQTSHGPFDLPAEFRTLKISADLDGTKLGGYLQSINYTDRQIGILLDKLKKSGVLDNTVLVIYGDHTGVHKYYDDQVQAMPNPEKWWLDDSKRIPLIIYHKDMKKQVINTTGGQIDLLPTLASLLGIDEEVYKNTAFGRNLLNTQKNFAVLANKQFVGRQDNNEEKLHAMNGLDISNLIVTKNYFHKLGY